MNTSDYSQPLNDSRADKTVRTLIRSKALDTAFEEAAGSIPFNLTNDYMFRAVFQSSNEALKGLLCSLLHLAESEVASVEITNPILLGKAIDNKEFHLDIHLLLNDSVRINLEMQIVNQFNWENRSVMYLCRTYDSLNRAQDYRDAKPAIHIGFLDYTLFEDRPEFYAAYKLINVKIHHVYNDNLTLYVADLTRIDLATEEDRRYHIDSWAKLFKAKTKNGRPPQKKMRLSPPKTPKSLNSEPSLRNAKSNLDYYTDRCAFLLNPIYGRKSECSQKK